MPQEPLIAVFCSIYFLFYFILFYFTCADALRR